MHPANSFVRRAHPASRVLGVLWPWLACASAAAQDGANRALVIEPTFTTALSVLDTRRGNGGSVSDAVLQLQPGLRVGANSSRLRGSLIYSMTALSHTAADRKSEIANSLSSNAYAELVPGWMYLEATAGVTQSVLSAFGQQSASLVTSNSNRTEVATVSVSPYLRGYLASEVSYELRLRATGSNTRRSKEGDSRAESALVKLASGGGLANWGLDLSSDRSHYRLGRDTQTDRALVSINLRPDPEVGVSVRSGRERSDVLTLERQGYVNWGGGVRWTPTERTVLAADFDRRYFGDSYTLTFNHRLPLSSVRVASSRNSSTGATMGSSGAVTLYQLYDLLLTSRYPDSTQRDGVVRQLLAGRDPNTLVQGGFVNTGISVSRRDDIGWTYGGPRLSLNLLAFRSSSRRLGAANSGTEPQTRQFGYTTVFGYQLTATASLSLNGSLLRTPAAGAFPASNLRTAALVWTDSIGRFTSVSANARYSVFNSTTDPYREAALTASLSLRF